MSTNEKDGCIASRATCPNCRCTDVYLLGYPAATLEEQVRVIRNAGLDGATGVCQGCGRSLLLRATDAEPDEDEDDDEERAAHQGQDADDGTQDDDAIENFMVQALTPLCPQCGGPGDISQYPTAADDGIASCPACGTSMNFDYRNATVSRPSGGNVTKKASPSGGDVLRRAMESPNFIRREHSGRIG